MKKFLIFFIAVMLNCSAVIAEDNLLNEKWLKTATVADVQREIANGADVNAKDKYGETVLMQAIYWDASPEIIKVLLDAGADVNVSMNEKPDRFGTTICIRKPLMYAVSHDGPLAIVKLLIEAGAEVNVRDNCGSTVLMYAAKYNTPEVVKLLINAGADVNAKNNGKAKNARGKTALMDVANNNYSPDRTGDIARVLIDAGADVNAQDEDEGSTALMKAAEWSKVGMVKVLIDAGADVNAKNKRGITALMLTHSAEIVKLLIDGGADVNATNNKGETALKRAVCSEDPEVVKMLLDAGAEGKKEYSPDECWGDLEIDMSEHCGGWC